MAIHIKPRPVETAEPEMHIEAKDADLIREILQKVGAIQAMQVTRWLCGCSLGTSKKFIDELSQ